MSNIATFLIIGIIATLALSNFPYLYGDPLTNGRIINMLGEEELTLRTMRSYSNDPCAQDPDCLDPYVPKGICVIPGTNVTWLNVGDVRRTATSGNETEGPSGEFDSGVLEPQESFSHIFRTTGFFEYFDKLHNSLKGQVEVNEKCPPKYSETRNYSSYKNNAHGIGIEYPSDWEKTVYNRSGDESFSVSFEDQNLPNVVRVIIERLEGKSNIREILMDKTSFCSDYKTPYNPTIIEFTNGTLSGYPAYDILCIYEYEDTYRDAKRESFVIGTIIGDKAYYIEYESSLKSFPIFFPVLQHMVDSFQVR